MPAVDDLRGPSEPPGGPLGSLYAVVRGDVLDGTFGPGPALQEAALAARYGVSRTPVRETLARLEQDGLVERAGRGYRVRSGTPEDVVEIYEVRTVLEAHAAATAAARRTDLDLARLHGLLAPCGDGPDGPGAPAAPHRARHRAWHEALWRAAHNTTLEQVLVRLTAQVRIYDRGTVETPGDLTLSDHEHAEVLAAVLGHDPERARGAMAMHLSRAREVRLQRAAQAPHAGDAHGPSGGHEDLR